MQDALNAQKSRQIQASLQATRNLKSTVLMVKDALQVDADVVDETQQKLDTNKASVEAEAKELAGTLREVLAGNGRRRCMFCYILLMFLVIGVLTRFT